MPERIITVGKVAGLCVCDHDPCIGVDCGVFLPGQEPRKPQPIKSAAEHAEIKARAWATRRRKYGERGHCGTYSRGNP